jgi:hypothetical protein
MGKYSVQSLPTSLSSLRPLDEHGAKFSISDPQQVLPLPEFALEAKALGNLKGRGQQIGESPELTRQL